MTTSKHRKFMKAYEGCHEPFVRYCSAMASSKMDTEDLVQDVLMSAFQHFEKIEKKGQLLHYLIRAAKNRSISVWRKRKNEVEMAEKHTDKLTAHGINSDVQYDILMLYKALEKLPTSQREAIILYEISGFSMKEIAEIQKSKEGAVKTKVSRGRDKLRQLLNEANVSSSTTQLLSVIKSIAL